MLEDFLENATTKEKDKFSDFLAQLNYEILVSGIYHLIHI
jgi:hypothetical protein